MKRFFILAFGIATLHFADVANAQNSASTTVNESATISQPIRIYKNTDLNFGGIVAGLVAGNIHVTGTIGTLTIPVSGNPTGATTTAVTYPGGSGPAKYSGAGVSGAGFNANVPAQVASLIVTGEACLTYSIVVSGGTTITDNTFPGHTMSVVLDHPTGGNVNGAGTAGQINNSGDPGTDKFTIGGVLTVGALQTSGVYTGNFNVVVAYN